MATERRAEPELPTGWQHVAVTLAGDTATIWLNGQEPASEDGVTLDPGDLGETDQNWIGRSQYADPPLYGGFGVGVEEIQVLDTTPTSVGEIGRWSGSPHSPPIRTWCPAELARHALVDRAEQLISQSRLKG